MTKSLEPRSVNGPEEWKRIPGQLLTIPTEESTLSYRYVDHLASFGTEEKDGLTYQALAESGDPEGQFALGMYALHGYPAKHFEDGLLWIQRAALNGLKAANFFLSRFFAIELPKDPEVRAALAATILAEMYETGLLLPKNGDIAKRWWEMAAHWAEYVPTESIEANVSQTATEDEPAS